MATWHEKKDTGEHRTLPVEEAYTFLITSTALFFSGRLRSKRNNYQAQELRLCTGYDHKGLENCLKRVGHNKLKQSCKTEAPIFCYYIAECSHNGHNNFDYSQYTCTKISHTTVYIGYCCTFSCWLNSYIVANKFAAMHKVGSLGNIWTMQAYEHTIRTFSCKIKPKTSRARYRLDLYDVIRLDAQFSKHVAYVKAAQSKLAFIDTTSVPSHPYLWSSVV